MDLAGAQDVMNLIYDKIDFMDALAVPSGAILDSRTYKWRSCRHFILPPGTQIHRYVVGNMSAPSTPGTAKPIQPWLLSSLIISSFISCECFRGKKGSRLEISPFTNIAYWFLQLRTNYIYLLLYNSSAFWNNTGKGLSSTADTWSTWA